MGIQLEKDVPSVAELSKEPTEVEILNFLRKKDINWSYVDEIKKLTGLNDQVIADWFNISVKTFRNYRTRQKSLDQNLKERVVHILVMLKHGLEIFGTPEAFRNWLNAPNFMLDNKSPLSYLDTITGIRFINDRLTAMEYGDNV